MRPTNIEEARQYWAEVAKRNGWYQEPFFVQVWVSKQTGKLLDAVSWQGVQEDIIVTVNEGYYEEDDETPTEFTQGVVYALNYLHDEVYGDSIRETDLWREYMTLRNI